MNESAVGCFLVLYLADEPLTTTDVAKEAFDPEGDRDLRNADRKVRRYFEESHPHLVDRETVNGTKHFTLAEDAVFFGAAQVQLVPIVDEADIEDGEVVEQVSVGLGTAMVYETESGAAQALSIDWESDKTSTAEQPL